MDVKSHCAVIRARRVFVLTAVSMAMALAAPSFMFAASGATVSGRVIDAATGAPLAGANVFLAQTTLGASADGRGTFVIYGVAPGAYLCVASMVGYDVKSETIQVMGEESVHHDFMLKARVLQTDEVTVTGQASMDWQKDLKFFTKEFIGSSRNADACRILNPEVINFRIDSVSSDLIASSDNILRVENLALGYRVDIVLSMFQWDMVRGYGHYRIFPRFETLRTDSRDTLQQWQHNRDQSYKGSLKHFLASLLAGTIAQEQFEISSGSLTFLQSGYSHALEPGEITVQSTDIPGLKRIAFKDWIRVDYSGEPSSTSFLSLNKGFVLADESGNLADPLSVDLIGHWAESRVADMLPLH